MNSNPFLRVCPFLAGLIIALPASKSASAADKFHDSTTAAGLTGGAGTWNIATAAVWSATASGDWATVADNLSITGSENVNTAQPNPPGNCGFCRTRVKITE